MLPILCFCLLLFCLPAMCSPAEAKTADSLLYLAPADIVVRIEQSRAAKDSLLRHDPNSPIPPELRAAFKGLNSYPVDPKFHLIGDLHLYGRRRQIQVPTTDTTFVPMERFGRFVAQLEGNPFWLEVYRSLEDHSLLVLFTDETNGQETYSGGRYVHLANLEKEGYLLDFNASYNPYCAYNLDYVCPLPPAQNRLSLPIRAGEKAYGADLAH